MAKDKNANASKDASTIMRTSIALPCEWMHVFKHLSTSRQKDLGEVVQGFLERELAGMPRAESEALRTIVRLATGKTLRVTGTTVSAAQESAAPATGEGHSQLTPATGSDLLAERIVAISNRAVDAPVAAAITAYYGAG